MNLDVQPGAAAWSNACEANARAIAKGVACLYCEGEYPPEWVGNRVVLERLHRAGFFAVSGQNGEAGRARDDDGQVVRIERRAMIAGFMPAAMAERVYRAFVRSDRYLMFKADPPTSPVHAAAIAITLIDGEPSAYLLASQTGTVADALPGAGIGELQTDMELASVAFVDLRWSTDARSLIRAIDAAAQQ